MSNKHDYAYEAGYRDGSIHYELEHCPACKNIADLQEALDENGRLRELIQRMHGHIKECCDECDGWYCSNFDEDNECCVFDTLARELGIEVEQ